MMLDPVIFPCHSIYNHGFIPVRGTTLQNYKVKFFCLLEWSFYCTYIIVTVETAGIKTLIIMITPVNILVSLVKE